MRRPRRMKVTTSDWQRFDCVFLYVHARKGKGAAQGITRCKVNGGTARRLHEQGPPFQKLNSQEQQKLL
jgi:hypothetical protein